MAKVVRFNIGISPEMHEYYKEQAKRAGMSMSAYMSYILFKNMNSEKKEQN